MATRALRPRGLEYDPEQACLHLRAVEPRLDALIARAGAFTMRPVHTQSLFAALAESIVYQQLSGKAAETILGRVVALCHPKRFPGPSDIVDMPPERLRGAGLSTNKTAALRDLAAKTIDGTVPSIALARRMDDEELVERLTLVRGIGRWTVEMLLIFRLGRPDVLPVSDLGVRKGYARTFRTRGLPTPEAMTRRAARWRPYRSIASWYLWRAVEQ
jgi:DNA-3-methyladenine glycosylase II